ncbi:MAG TPA: hypothetical protein VF112_08125 [Candidatus Dormibacteraeota bacterium]
MSAEGDQPVPGVPPEPPEEPGPEVLPPPAPPFEPRLPAPPPPGSRAAAGEEPAPAARPLRTPPPNYLPPPSARPRPPVMAPIEPDPARRSGRPAWVWVVAGLASLLVLVVVLVLVLRSQSSGPVVVGTDVALDATSQTSGDCVTTVHFTARGSLSGTGTITYRFDRSDGQSTGNQQLSVDGNSGFELTEDWRFAGVHNGGGTMVFHIVSPTTREVRHDVTVRCP